jgi:hypothetical protein
MTGEIETIVVELRLTLWFTTTVVDPREEDQARASFPRRGRSAGAGCLLALVMSLGPAQQLVRHAADR